MKRTIIIISLCIIASNANSQDVHSSQFWNNGTQYNPAMTGVIPATLRASAFYRNQWSSVNSLYSTFGFNFDTRIDTRGSTSFGLGTSVYRDMAGDNKLGTTGAQLSFSTILALDRNSKISIGVNGGIIQKGFDASNAQWNSQYSSGSYDPTIASGEQFNSLSELKGDLSVGAVYYYSTNARNMTANDAFNMKVGFSYNHILQPTFNWFSSGGDDLYSNFVAHAEFQIGMENTPWTIIPAAIVQFQGPSKEILVGSQFRFTLKEASKVTGFVKGAYLFIGTFYRVSDAFIPSITIDFDKYSLGFSYDVNTSSLRSASSGAGGFEISFKFRNPNPYLWQGSRRSSSKWN